MTGAAAATMVRIVPNAPRCRSSDRRPAAREPTKEEVMQDREPELEPVELDETELTSVAGGLKAMWMDEE